MKVREWEKVKMFRCVTDPMVGPKPKNAFMLPDLPDWEAWLHVASGSVHIKVPTQKGPRRHVVGTGNLSSIELYREDESLGEIQNSQTETTQNEQTKRSPGRPKLQPLGS